MKVFRTMAFLATATVVSGLASLPAHAIDNNAAQKGVEGPRDTNLFQVEPTVIDERYYTSGRAERHQKISPTLPEGSPIPDSPGVNTTPEAKSQLVQNSNTSAATAGATTVTATTSHEEYMTPLGDKRKLAGKIDPTFQIRLNAEIRNETNKFYMKLRVADTSSDVVKQLKEVNQLRVVTVDAKKREIVVEAPAKSVSAIADVPAVKFITRQ